MSKHYTSYNKYSEKSKDPEPVIEEDVIETKPEKIPEEEIVETTEVDMPKKGELTSNLYIREKPYGDHVEKDGLERFLSAHVLVDEKGNAVLPKKTKVDIYDMMVHEDGSVWYNTRFGYLMAKDKTGIEYIVKVD